MNEIAPLFTSIDPIFKRRILLKGTFLAAIGAFILLAGGALIPASHLSLWGAPLVLLAIILIAGGLIPYRRLCKKELCPDRIEINESFHFFRKGRLILAIPFQAIASLSFVSTLSYYGLMIHLYPHCQQKIAIHFFIPELTHLRRSGRKKVEIFLPFFSSGCVDKLKARLNNVVHFNQASNSSTSF